MAVAACSGSDPTPTPAILPTVELSSDPTPTPTPQVVLGESDSVEFTVYLSSNGSPQTGTATFKQVSSGTVELRVNVSPSVPVQRMSLRRGQCPDIGSYMQDLEQLIGGHSVQRIRNMNINSLMTGDVMLVISARSSSFQPVASCADLPSAEESIVSG